MSKLIDLGSVTVETKEFVSSINFDVFGAPCGADSTHKRYES